jgi:hypothetical protein
MVPPHRVEVALPAQFAAQPSNLHLPAQTHNSPQAQLNGFALGLNTRGAKRIAHEFVVNYNVRPQDVYPFDQLYTLYPSP